MKKVKKGFVVLVSILVSIMSVSGNEKEVNRTVNEPYAQAAQLMQDWPPTRDIDGLMKIFDAVAGLDDQDDSGTLRQRKIGLIFALLKVMDENYDPNYEKPLMNMTPPSFGDIHYRSGIAPELIKEPEIRAAYEKALERNRLVAANASFQLKLGRMRAYWVEYVVDDSRRNGLDEEQFKALLSDHEVTEKSQEELTVLFELRNNAVDKYNRAPVFVFGTNARRNSVAEED